jgi:hypothetical protein
MLRRRLMKTLTLSLHSLRSLVQSHHLHPLVLPPRRIEVHFAFSEDGQ